MNRSGRRSHLTALLTAILVSIGLLSLSTAPVWAAAGTITEFPVPSGVPEFITVGPDDNLWFAEFNVGLIGRITPGGNIKEFPVAQTGPTEITTGPDGNLWFTLSFGNSIGRISPSGGKFTSFSLPSTCQNRFGCTPLGITAGPAHNSDVWFTELRGAKIGCITTQ